MYSGLFKWVVIIIFVTGTFSCKLAYIVVDVTVPASVTIPENIKSIVVNNRLADSSLTLDSKKDVLLTGTGKDDVSSSASLKVMRGLIEAMIQNDRFLYKGKVLNYIKKDAEIELPVPLSAEKVEKICRDFDADALISLESFQYSSGIIYDSFETVDPADRYKSSANTIRYDTRHKSWYNTIRFDIRKIEYFNAILKVNVKLGWRVYSAIGGEVIYEGYQPDSVAYEVQGPTKEEVRKRLPSIITVVEKAGSVAGTNVLNKISPSFRTVERYYFKKANNDFREAWKLVKFRRWEDAGNLWEPYLNSSNLKERAMASYNMALIAEMNGDIDQAGKLINQAAELYPMKDILEYRSVIMSR